MPTLRLALLGPPHFSRDHQTVELKIAKVQALLAYLAVTRVPQPREHLLALLWAESHPAAARKNLRNRLWLLRQALGEASVITTDDTIALAPTVWTDVAMFEQGLQDPLPEQTALVTHYLPLLTLWRGPFLHGLHLAEAPDFELWLTTERARLGQLYLQGLTNLIANRQHAADWEQVIVLAQRGLAYDPLQEPLHQQLMLAYAQQGARTTALRQYDRLRTSLAQELGVDPLAETTAIRTAIVNSEIVPQNKLIESKTPSITVVPSLPTVTQTFIGRQTELTTLELAWQRAGRGTCQVVLLSGELGIGKTQLWQHWSASLAPDQVILETRCLNTTQTIPLEPLRRWLSGAQARRHFAAHAADLWPIWQAELLRLAPNLQTSAWPAGKITPAPAAALSPSEERGQVDEALTQFLRSFGAAPLILFLDDLHWADAATLHWLLYLTDRMATEPLLLIGAYRPEDASPTLTRVVAQWQRENLLQRISVPKLTSQETVELLAALESNVALADYLHTQSGGNPYYLTQLSDIAIDGIPASLAELVRARLSYLDSQWQPFLQAAAVLEPSIDVETLQHTSQRSEAETLDALDGLLAAAVLVERVDAYEFAHPLVATVVRDGLSSSRRKVLHRRTAEGLALRYADQLPAIAGQLARHYREAGERTKSAYFAEMAGEEAFRIGASEAVGFYQQAYTLEPTPARQLGVGCALMLLPGQMAEARTTMQQALTAFEAQGDRQGAVKAGLRLAASYLATQDGAQVLYWARRVLPDLELVDDVALHASAHYLMGTSKFRSGYALREAAAHYAEATHLATKHHLESEIALMSWFEWGNLCLEQGDYAAAVAKFQLVRRVAQASKSVVYEALSLNNLAYATLLMGEVATARDLIEAGLALAATYALLPMQQYFYSTRGEIALADGELPDAERWLQQALALAQKNDNAIFVANVHAHLGRVAQARGALDEAYTLLTVAQAAVHGDAARYLQTQIALWLAELHLLRGDGPATEASLRLAEAQLANDQHPALQQKAHQLRAELRFVIVQE